MNAWYSSLNRPALMRMSFCGVLIVASLTAGCLGSGRRAGGSPQTGNAGVPRHPDDAVSFGGHYYKVFIGPDSWHDKARKCESLGGYLACVESADEHAFVAHLANGRYLSLGGSDEGQEGKWRWINGAPWEFTAWMTGQPNNYGGHENYLATYTDGKWVDVDDEGTGFWMPTGYICEWDQ